MTKHEINLEYLGEAANILMGPEGSLRLAVIYATLEKIAKTAHESRLKEGEYAYAAGYKAALESAERAKVWREQHPGDVVTLNEDALHGSHYDTFHQRYQRPGSDE